MDFDRNAASRLAEKYESFYLYDEGAILDSIERLRKSFDGVRFLYSAKANPHPGVLSCILSEGIGVDAVGDYNAVGKRSVDIVHALAGCRVIDIVLA